MREATTKSPAQRDKILTWLRMRGQQGVLNTELTQLCMRFGARIHELRREGHRIDTERLSESQFRFVLVGDRGAQPGLRTGGGDVANAPCLSVPVALPSQRRLFA